MLSVEFILLVDGIKCDLGGYSCAFGSCDCELVSCDCDFEVVTMILTVRELVIVIWEKFSVFENDIENKISGGHLSIKMSSYQGWDPHVKDKTVSQPSNL